MKSHSWLSDKCQVRSSPKGGMGLFAARPFASLELIGIWGGIVVTQAELESMRHSHPGIDDRCIAVAKGFWLAPAHLDQGDDSEKMNHSCEPNAGIKGQILIVARRNIETDEEITIDYETIETDFPPFSCKCSSRQCRGRIDGTAHQDPLFLKANQEFLSHYLARPIQP